MHSLSSSCFLACIGVSVLSKKKKINTFYIHCFLLHIGATNSGMSWFSGPAMGPIRGAGAAAGPVTGVGVSAGPIAGFAVAAGPFRGIGVAAGAVTQAGLVGGPVTGLGVALTVSSKHRKNPSSLQRFVSFHNPFSCISPFFLGFCTCSGVKFQSIGCAHCSRCLLVSSHTPSLY